MKKLFSVGILLSLVLVLLTGCQSPGPEQDLGDKFIFEEDNQYYFYLSGLFGKPIAESETSYYASVDGYVYTRDKKTGECAPLCNKPDCTHDNREFLVGGASNCNAYFGAVQQISYYKGKLYVLSVNTVYEMDASGSTRKKLIESKESIGTSMVHRGYLYLTFSDYYMASEEYAEEELKDLSYRIERYRLDQWDGKPEIVYEKKGEWGQINAIFAYGNRAYFDITAAETSRIMLYHLADNSLSEISGISGYPCVVDGNLLYFEEPEEKRIEQDFVEGEDQSGFEEIERDVDRENDAGIGEGEAHASQAIFHRLDGCGIKAGRVPQGEISRCDEKEIQEGHDDGHKEGDKKVSNKTEFEPFSEQMEKMA